MKRNVDVMRAFAAIVSAALFSVIFAVLASSCTDNSSSQPITPEKKKNATLKLTLTGTSVANGRATGDALPTKADNINTLAVGIFNADDDGSVNVIAECTVVNNEVQDEILCSAGLCDVIVVANAPTGTFDGVQNKEQFLRKTVDLSQTATNDVQTSDNLPMSGQTPASIELVANTATEVSVSLIRLVARISIESIKTKFTVANSNSNATFTLDKVFIYNALYASHIAPGDATLTMPVNPVWIDGGRLAEDNSWIPGKKYLLNQIEPVVLSGDGDSEYKIPNWFYAFANNDTEHSTKVVIGGLYDPDGPLGTTLPTYVYYPIVVNQAQEGTNFQGSGAGEAHDGTITRNVDYRLSATIAKKGVATPDDEISVAEMQLTVSVAEWKLTIEQEVTIE